MCMRERKDRRKELRKKMSKHLALSAAGGVLQAAVPPDLGWWLPPRERAPRQHPGPAVRLARAGRTTSSSSTRPSWPASRRWRPTRGTRCLPRSAATSSTRQASSTTQLASNTPSYSYTEWPSSPKILFTLTMELQLGLGGSGLCVFNPVSQ